MTFRHKRSGLTEDMLYRSRRLMEADTDTYGGHSWHHWDIKCAAELVRRRPSKKP